MGGTCGHTSYLCQLQRLPQLCFWTWERESSCSGGALPPAKCFLKPLPRFLLRLSQRPRLPFTHPSPSPLLSLHVHLLCFAGCCREEAEEWEPLPNHGLLSLPHAYIPVVPMEADQAHWGQNKMADSGMICVGIIADRMVDLDLCGDKRLCGQAWIVCGVHDIEYQVESGV